MACVSKEYEGKTKIVQQQWLQLEITFLLGYSLKSGGIDFWCEGDFSRWGNEQSFSLGGDSPIPPVGKTLGFFTIEQV